MPAKTTKKTKVIEQTAELPRSVIRLYDIHILLKNGEKFFLHEIQENTREYILKQYNYGVKHLHIPMAKYVNFEDYIESPWDRFIQMETIAELNIKPFTANLAANSPEKDTVPQFRYELGNKEWKPL